MLKLCIGSGKIKYPGYVNCDIVKSPTVDLVMDVKELDQYYREGTVDEIYMPHIIENFNRFDAERVFKQLHKALKKDGKLILELVDLEKCAEMYLSKDPQKKKWGRNGFYSEQKDEADKAGWHVWGYNKDDIKKALEDNGFKVDEIKYGGTHCPERDLVVKAHK